jgi:hypothetical protein
MRQRSHRVNAETDRIVRAIDQTRQAEHFRNPDRPNGRTLSKRSRQAIEITRAKTRLRTAHYRNRLDERRAPTTAQLGAALVHAFATAPLDLKPEDWNLIMLAMADLDSRGFAVEETKTLLRSVRARYAKRDGHVVSGSGAGPSGY